MFDKNVLDQLLRQTDSFLSKKVDLVLIGGTAIVLKYLSMRTTFDVDAYNKVSKELLQAWKKAEDQMGVKMPLSKSPILEGPYNMEDRFTKYTDLNLKKLNIFVPDPMDLVLMKMIRLIEKDQDDIRHLIKQSKIKNKLLLQRFQTEMDHVVCDHKVLQGHYLFCIEDNFGKKTADNHARKLRG